VADPFHPCARIQSSAFWQAVRDPERPVGGWFSRARQRHHRLQHWASERVEAYREWCRGGTPPDAGEQETKTGETKGEAGAGSYRASRGVR
jgi:hypothetical protein